MSTTTPKIREKMITEMHQEYVTIFELGDTDALLVLSNLRNMSDIQLAHEIVLLEEYHSTEKSIYLRGLIQTLEFASEEEKINNDSNLILNF